MPRWFRCFDSRPFAAVRLICFPHAGGSAAFFRTWAKAAVPGIEIHAVQYPGRADRLTDPLVGEARLLALPVADALAPLLDRPVALFGHSMGATIAYETAHLLSARGTPPAHLFVSASRAAHDRRRTEPVAHKGDDAVIAALQKLGGTEAELLADPQIRALILPYVRNDLRLVESYRHQAGRLLSCPVTAYGGEDDPVVEPAGLGRWTELTTGEFTSRVFAGSHFYLASQAEAVLAAVERALAPLIPPE